MGLMERAREASAPAAAQGYQTPCPYPDHHFQTEVNKGSLRVQTWQAHINDMYKRGYRLSHVFEQDGNTVQVFEHHFHP